VPFVITLRRRRPSQSSPPSGDLCRPHVHELGLENRLAVLEQHRDDLAEVLLQLGEVGPLRMRSGPTRDTADQDSSQPIPY
jgi:hypothetical protein